MEHVAQVDRAVARLRVDGDDRQVYVDYLRGRLGSPRTFVEEAEQARERR